MKTSILLLFMIIIWNFSLSQMNEIDSLKKLLVDHLDDSLRVVYYNDIADAYSFVNIDSSLSYSKKTYDLAEKIGFGIGMGRAKNTEAQAYFRQGIYDKADSLYKIAIAYHQKNADTFGLAITINNLGLVYMNQSKYKEALDLFLESIEHYKASKHEDKIPATLANIGVLYYYQNNIEMALKYMISAANGMKGYDSKRSILYRNIGAFYSLQNKMDSAFFYAGLGIKIDSVTGNIKGLATSYNNLAEFYSKLGDFNKAADYFFKSLEIKKELNDQRGLMFAYHNLGLLYDTLHNYQQGLEYHLKAMEYAQKMNNLETQVLILLDLSRSYNRLNDIKKSFNYYRQYHSLSDSLNKSIYNSDLMDIQTKYETEKKEQEIEKLTQEKKLEELKTRKNKIVAIISTLSAIILLVLLYYIIRLLNIKKLNNSILREQNEEINQQKEEIAAQKDEIENQRDQVIEQKEYIEKQNKEINDSIIYAQQIQMAVFPKKKLFENLFNEYFILNQPKDVVSGDFYWITEKENKIILAVADCTGHGVPGAFMSLLGITYLNEIFRETNILNPSEILIMLREKVISGMQQEGKRREAKDGMVVSLCIIDKRNGKIQFSGAGSDLLFLQNGNLNEVKGDKQSIAFGSDNAQFVIHELDYSENDVIYLYTDGYIDQFNHDGTKKFSRKKLFDLMLKLKDVSLPEQKKIYKSELQNWKGNFEQIDDILICGVKL